MSIEFVGISDNEKTMILDILGFEVDKEGLIISKKNKKPHICPISKEKVFLKNASILPWNSNIIINTSALTISEYLSELDQLNKNREKNDRISTE